MSFSKFSLFAAALVLTAFSATVQAAPSTMPVLAKRTSTVSSTGKVRSTECLLYTDGLQITRNLHGIITTENRDFKIQGDLNSKIDEVIATKPEVKKTSTLEYSYSLVAFKTSASGVQDTIVISSFDGTTGEDIYNPAPSGHLLRDLINGVCN